MPLGNSSDWVRAAFEMADLDITFNAFAKDVSLLCDLSYSFFKTTQP
jgi:hypothetical protein